MSMTRSWVATALIAIVAIASNCVPSTAAEVGHGEQLAPLVFNLPSGGQRSTFFLLDPHPKMPNLSLSRREAEDIAAYIASLAK